MVVQPRKPFYARSMPPKRIRPKTSRIVLVEQPGIRAMVCRMILAETAPGRRPPSMSDAIQRWIRERYEAKPGKRDG